MEITNIKPLYRYENADGSISITPIQRNEGDPVYKYRLIADEGYELYFEGENKQISVLDVFSVEGWTQELIPEEPIDPSEDDGTEEDYINALIELGVNLDE